MRKVDLVVITVLVFTFFIPGDFCYSSDFISIEGNEINYEIRGSGEPWIILVNGSGLDMSSLDPIFEELSRESTVVRYSRAGLGKSSYTNKGKDFEDIVNELQLLIQELRVPEPFILGGHSFGGLMVKAFATKNPSKVAGLLSIDPAFEENWKVLTPHDPEIRKKMQGPLDYFWKSRPDNPATHEFQSFMTVYDSPERWEEWFDYPSTIPHFIITSLKTSDAPNSPGRGSREIMLARAEVHDRVAAKSDVHIQIRTADAGHEVYKDQPQLVIDAFKMLINLVKASKSW